MMASSGPKKTGRVLNPYERALAHPKSMKYAIRAKCWYCEGEGKDPGWRRRIRHCVVDRCPLWHVRPYQRKRSGGRFCDPNSAGQEVGTGSREIGLKGGSYGPPTGKDRILDVELDPVSDGSRGRER
jgi:hypothetical protein